MTASSEFAEFCRLAASGGLVAVAETVSADLLTPLSAYLRIAQGAERSFLLESVEGGEHLARYSFLGAEPAMVVRSRDGVTTVQDANGERTEPGTAVDILRREFAHRKLAAAENIAPMAGGCVGYLGYAASSWFDPAMQAVSGAGDDACFLIFRTVLAFDHARQQIQIRTLAEVEPGASEAVLQEKFDAASAQNREVVRKLSAAVELPLKAMAVAGAGEADFESNFARAEFESAVAEGKELIFAGECFQIVLSQRFRRKTKANAVALYRALRATNPSPYMFLLNFGPTPRPVRSRWRASLDRRIAGDAGALPRPRVDLPSHRRHPDPRRECGRGCATGRRAARRREGARRAHDAGRSRAATIWAAWPRYGTVKVKKLMTVEKYSHVQHLVTELQAELRPELDRFDALGACFPAGTVTGAPKIRAMQGIADLERGARLSVFGRGLVCRLRQQSRLLHHHPHHGAGGRRAECAGGRGHCRRLRAVPGVGRDGQQVARAASRRGPGRVRGITGRRTMLLVIDNYDSFTYNLVQFLGELGADPVVRRNDQVTVRRDRERRL